MSTKRKFLIGFLILWFGVVFTFGHVYHQLKAETAEQCAKEDPQWCLDWAQTRGDAFVFSVILPMHWPEMAWAH